jgi:uracil-DNA glycosylase family 4
MTLQTIYDDTLRAVAALGKTKADMVYGEGDEHAAVMLIGEAPGAEETRLSRPFVGRAGRNLDEFLCALCLSRGDIYITNVVKFRPYKVSAKGTLSNRPTTNDETAYMLPLLLREIEAVAPDVVVTLGNVPLKCLLGKQSLIGSCHAAPAKSKALSHGFTVFPLYHPASVIYNSALRDVYREDIEKLKAFISDAPPASLL